MHRISMPAKTQNAAEREITETTRSLSNRKTKCSALSRGWAYLRP